MENMGLGESQAGIKTSRRNNTNLKYANETTIMAEREEELKSFDEDERREWKAGLKLHIQKTIRSCHLVPALHSK